MARLNAVVFFMIRVSATIGQQSSSQCSGTDSTTDECILHHISDKLEQMSTLERKIDSTVQHIADKVQEGIGESQCNCPSNPDLSCPDTLGNAATDDSLPENCLTIYIRGHHSSGIYTVYEPIPIAVSPFRSFSRQAITVFCDMDEESPSWMVFQRRQDGAVNFNRTWAGYRNGFGNIAGEHWLGNDNLAIITGASIPYELQVDLEDWEGEKRHARYSSFKIQPEAFNYRLAVGNYSGDAGDSMTYHNNMQFSTPDNDNDLIPSENCAELQFWAGWWYQRCSHSSLNSPVAV